MTKVILTGTACAGKSELLEVLARKGYPVVREAETPIVQELKSKLGDEGTKRWILKNYAEFKSQVGERQREIELATPSGNLPVFYDRSAICYLGYCRLRNTQAPQILLDLAKTTNPDYVLFVERLGEFNVRRDTGRFMSESEASLLAELIRDEYEVRGLSLINVPEFSSNKEVNLAARVNYIEGILISK